MKKKSFWPYGILISIILCVCACAYTIYVCLDYPVYVDNGRFASYQEVDYKINEMDNAQENFEKEFGKGEFRLFANNELVNEEIMLKRKKAVKTASSDANFLVEFNIAPKNSKIEAFLTRPDTSIYDKELKTKFQDDIIQISGFDIEKKGRWQVKLKIDASDEITQKVGVYGFEFFAK